MDFDLLVEMSEIVDEPYRFVLSENERETWLYS